MRRMHGEEIANSEDLEKQPREAVRTSVDQSSNELAQSVRLLCEEVISKEVETQNLEPITASKEELRGLSDDILRQQLEVLREQLELGERARELDQRALKLGLLQLANKAPRCTHLKANGKPCRAPAMGNRLFCVFHCRALETEESPKINITVLEDRESLQLTVKQIMEQIVSGRIDPQNAALLLRAVQIAGSTLKPSRRRVVKRKPARSETADVWANPEENSA